MRRFLEPLAAILFVMGISLLIVGGIAAVITGAFYSLNYFATSIIIMMAGIVLVTICIMFGTHNVKTGGRMSLEDGGGVSRIGADLIENVRLICEKLGPEFSNLIKMDIYQKCRNNIRKKIEQRR